MANAVMPLGVAELQGVLTGSGQSLPGPAYTDPEVLAFEQQHFFTEGWVCVGRSADLKETGKRRAFSVGDDSVLVVRGADGTAARFLQQLPPSRPSAAAVRRRRHRQVHPLPVPRVGLQHRR